MKWIIQLNILSFIYNWINDTDSDKVSQPKHTLSIFMLSVDHTRIWSLFKQIQTMIDTIVSIKKLNMNCTQNYWHKQS
jgi:hypothetical protein